MKTSLPLSCIVCDYQPESACPEEIITSNQPHKATEFISYGHYGSTFFDPMDGSTIAINICDECLKKAKEKNQILYLKQSYHYPRTYGNKI